MAWMDLLESSGVDPSLLSDMNKDVNRLSVIAELFSKIGSKPEMELIYVNEVLEMQQNICVAEFPIKY